MEEIQKKYIQTGISSKGYLYCSGDDVSFSFNIHKNNINDYDTQI